MSYEQKDMSGSLWANDKKETEKHPDRTGTAVIGGREYWVSGWLKKSKDGKPYLSLAFKPKDAKREPAPKQDRGRAEDIRDEDPLPF